MNSKDDADPLTRAVDLFHGWQLEAAFDLLADLTADPDRMAALPPLARATSLRLFAEVSRERGRLDVALPLAAPLVEQCINDWGRHHPVTLRAAVCYGEIQQDLGQLERAEFLYRTVLEGAGHRRRHTARAVLLARANLALIGADRGETVTSIEALTQCLAGFRREFGRFDPHTIRVTRHLAELHLTSGDPVIGRRLLTVTHASALSALGEVHPATRLLEDDLYEAVAAQRRVAPDAEPRAPRRFRANAVWQRRPVRTAAYIAALAAAVSLVTVVLNLPRHSAEQAAQPPTMAAAPPTHASPLPEAGPPVSVAVTATTSKVTITWQDPSKGLATPVVTVNAADRETSLSLPAGTRKYTLRGYPATVTVCVTVSLLWPGAEAPQKAVPVCA